MRRILNLYVLICLAALLSSPALLAADPPVTYVRAGKLLDVRAGKMLANQVIVIRGERIERVASSSDITIPSGATVVDKPRHGSPRPHRLPHAHYAHRH